ncbi:MAG: hypothetical protein KIT84_10955 [Labilithrix sp.]|nr:hypothetical protein [Labilithrix sp.]MCW5811526.1 hypothetical protein [Labilithrix sp.]
MKVLHLGWSVWNEGQQLSTARPESRWSYYWQGRRTGQMPFAGTGKAAMDVLKEYVFEEVRRSDFKAAPSRQRCLFAFPPQVLREDEAVATLESMALVRSPTVQAFWKKGVWKVLMELELAGGAVHIGDSKLLDCSHLTVEQIETEAGKYWRGEGNTDELLYEGPFRVTRMVKSFEPQVLAPR